MNSRERVKKAFHFDKPDRVPMSQMNLKTDFFPVHQYHPKSWQPQNYPPHVRGGVEKITKITYRKFVYNWKNTMRKEAGYSKKWWKNPHESIDEWNTIWKSSGTESADVTKGHPFKGFLQDDWDKINDYKIPDASNPERYRMIKTKIWKLLGKNRYTVGEMGANGLFNQCSQIRGFTNLLIDFARHSQEVDQLINKILPFYLIQIEKFKGYYPTLDSIIIADDLGTQKSPFISPRIFQKFFKEPYKEIIDLTHELGMDFILHSCGQIFELMPDIIDINVDVFEFDSPHMTGVENFKKFAKERKVAFWLSSNIQSTYPLGTPEEVEEEIKHYIKEVGNNEGGLAIYEYMSNKVLRTPKGNIISQREATLKWGNYNENGFIDWLA
ncbi:MAG: uroporphyrinogen decarboxylase family protein [Candidatus Hodarchaeota archaeon]